MFRSELFSRKLLQSWIIFSQTMSGLFSDLSQPYQQLVPVPGYESHPLLRDTMGFHGGSYSHRVPCCVKQGCVLVATWTDTNPLVCYRQAVQGEHGCVGMI